MILKPLNVGDIILYDRSNTFYGKLIRKYQKKENFSDEDSRFTHIEISLGIYASINASFPKIKINRDFRSNNIGRYIKILRPKIFDYREKAHDITMICANRVNTIYGLGILWFILKDTFKRNIFSAVGDFCSELIGYGLSKKYVDELKYPLDKILPKRYDELYPADFLNKDYFEVINEGIIK